MGLILPPCVLIYRVAGGVVSAVVASVADVVCLIILRYF